MKIDAAATRAAKIVALPTPDGDDARRVEVSFSSEHQVIRDTKSGPVLEVLSHDPADVDLSRMGSGSAPLLTDHLPSVRNQIGVVEKVWLDGDKGRAVVRFASTPDADTVLEKVRDEIVTNVSVGYRITSAKATGEDGPDGLPIVRVRWQPYEISFVSIPADPTVGLGRADTDTPAIDVQPMTNTHQERDTMSDPIQNPAPKAAPKIDAAAVRREALTNARTASRAVETLARKWEVSDDKRDAALDAIAEANDPQAIVVDFREAALEAVEARQAEASEQGSTRIGMQSENVREWSLFNAMRYAMNPGSAKAADQAGFEIECSRALEDKLGREAGGIFIPDEVLADQNFARAQSTATPSAGGALVPTTYMGGSFIDLLRNRLANQALGARILSGLVGDVDIPKRLTGGTLYWLDEDEDVTDSESTFGTISLTAHDAGMGVPITRRMMQNAVPSIEALVRDDLLEGIAVGTDHVALYGHASPAAPTGLIENLTGTDWGVANTPEFAEVVALETAMDSANSLDGSLAYGFGAKIAGGMKTTPKFAGGEIPILSDSGMVNGYRGHRTNQFADGDMVFGNWADQVIAFWSGVDLRMDTATKAKSDGKVLRAFITMDVVQRRLESFTYGKNA